MKKVLLFLCILSGATVSSAQAQGQVNAAVQARLAVFEIIEKTLSVGRVAGYNNKGLCYVTYEKVLNPTNKELVTAIRLSVELAQATSKPETFTVREEQANDLTPVNLDDRVGFRLGTSFMILRRDLEDDSRIMVLTGQGKKGNACSIEVNAVSIAI